MSPMTHTLGRRVVPAAALALLASGLAGCGLLDGSSRVEKALEYLPAGTTSVTFVDRAKAGDDFGTALTVWDRAMDGAAFGDDDIEWEATGTGEGGLARVWRMKRDLDFDEVAEDLLDAGYERSGPDDRLVFHADLEKADPNGLVGGRYPAQLLDIALVPDESVILTGGDAEAAARASTDDADSLADEGAFGDLLDRAEDQDDLAYAAVSTQPLCGAGARTSPAQAEELSGDLGTPDAMALFVRPDQPVAAVRLFDGDGAEADEKALADYLEESAPRTGFDADLDVSRDGDVVEAEAPWSDRQQLVAAWARGEGPFACAAG